MSSFGSPKTPVEESNPRKTLLQNLGPGLITGAADDDPSGIATYSQAGAQFGNNVLWTIVITYPLMVAIQVVSARLGRVTGRGLAGIMMRHYSRSLVYPIVSLLLIANTINIAADISAMGDAVSLLFGGSSHLYAGLLGFICCLLQIFMSYQRCVRVLKWLTLVLFAYVGVVFAVHIHWADVVKGIFYPSVSLNATYVTTIVAIFGTTISPYLFFWQATQEVEDIHASKSDQPLLTAPKQALEHLRRIKLDTVIGMGISNLIAFFIILTTAATLHQHGINNIETSAQAAEALRPIAGPLAFLLFGLGILGTGLLAVPVLASSTAFAIAETFHWKRGLDLQLRPGWRFYAIIAAATLIGVVLGFTSLDPIKALFLSAVINGVISVPIMAVMMRMASSPAVMGPFVISRRLRLLGWSATAVMGAAALMMLAENFSLNTSILPVFGRGWFIFS